MLYSIFPSHWPFPPAKPLLLQRLYGFGVPLAGKMWKRYTFLKYKKKTVIFNRFDQYLTRSTDKQVMSGIICIPLWPR